MRHCYGFLLIRVISNDLFVNRSRLPVAELRTPYYLRATGSTSKLSTWRDGLRILRTIGKLYRSERPLPLSAMPR